MDSTLASPLRPDRRPAAGGGLCADDPQRPHIPRILFLINSLAGGGAERVLTTVLEHSADRRGAFDMRLALLDAEPRAYAPPAWLGVTELKAEGSLVRSIGKVRGLVRQSKPDLTLSFLTRSNIANVLAHIGHPGAVVLSERVHTANHLGAGGGARAAKGLVRFAYPRADGVIAVSQGVSAHLIEDFHVLADRVTCIHNPLNLAKIEALSEAPQPVTPRRPYVLAMGRLVENKNFDLLLRAFARLDEDLDLVIAGEGPHRARLEALVAGLGLTDRVTLPGFLANPYPLLRQALFYVLPSNAEGFPNGLVEAMALGLPVISTDCPSGPAEILQGQACPGRPVDARWGVLTACNDVEAMRRAMSGFLSPERRRHFGIAARERAQCFSVQRAVDAYWSVIETVLKTRAASAPVQGARIAWR